MNVIFILMLYDGGKRSTVTKYGTCMLQSRNNQQQEVKKRPIRCDHDLVLRQEIIFILPSRNIEQNNVEEKKLQLA